MVHFGEFCGSEKIAACISHDPTESLDRKPNLLGVAIYHLLDYFALEHRYMERIKEAYSCPMEGMGC